MLSAMSLRMCEIGVLGCYVAWDCIDSLNMSVQATRELGARMLDRSGIQLCYRDAQAYRNSVQQCSDA